MYWYKIKNQYGKAAVATALAALFFSCSSDPATTASRPKEKHIDIPLFFKEEIKRLQQAKPLVRKTVRKDELSEQKEVRIENWSNELASFETVDLNKAAYDGLFDVDSTADKIVYSSSDPDVDLSHVEIQFSEDRKPKNWIIKRRIKNSLYQTDEILKYSRDSAYSIEKDQSVLILGDKHYGIEATFIK